MPHLSHTLPIAIAVLLFGQCSGQTTLTPTTAPATLTPTLAPTNAPATLTPTSAPATLTPTSAPPTTAPPTLVPTSAPPTLTPTAAPPTLTPTSAPPTLTPTQAPLTPAPPTPAPPTPAPRTPAPATPTPRTPTPVTSAPITLTPTTPAAFDGKVFLSVVTAEWSTYTPDALGDALLAIANRNLVKAIKFLYACQASACPNADCPATNVDWNNAGCKTFWTVTSRSMMALAPETFYVGWDVDPTDSATTNAARASMYALVIANMTSSTALDMDNIMLIDEPTYIDTPAPDTSSDDDTMDWKFWVLIGLAALLVICCIILLCLLLRGKKGSSKDKKDKKNKAKDGKADPNSPDEEKSPEYNNAAAYGNNPAATNNNAGNNNNNNTTTNGKNADEPRNGTEMWERSDAPVAGSIGTNGRSKQGNSAGKYDDDKARAANKNKKVQSSVSSSDRDDYAYDNQNGYDTYDDSRHKSEQMTPQQPGYARDQPIYTPSPQSAYEQQWFIGELVDVLYGDEWFHAQVVEQQDNGLYTVNWEDGTHSRDIMSQCIRRR